MSLLLISPRSPWTRGAGARLCISQPTRLTACKLCFKICFIQNGRSRSAVVTKAVTGCLRNGAGRSSGTWPAPPPPAAGAVGSPGVWSHTPRPSAGWAHPSLGMPCSGCGLGSERSRASMLGSNAGLLGGGGGSAGLEISFLGWLVWRRVPGRPGVPGPSPAEWVGLGPGRSTDSSAQKRRLSGGGKGGRLCGLWASESPS